MATPTAVETVTKVITKVVSAATASSTNRATPQGGVLEPHPVKPTTYDPKNPIIIFIIQAGIMIVVCRLLHYPLSLLRQPRVIAEVIAGIVLGPSVMGHIPGFTNNIFPQSAMPNLTLVANLGLVLFLFLVGLEVDLRYFASNWRVALSVGLAGMILPFGLGCAIAWGIYHEFRDDPGTVPISFGVYMLFIGVAMAITAFPVLCRILTELKLLGTTVGIIVLSAGVGNDVVGWILLALCVALVNANTGLTALWVLLVAVGYALFLAFAVRPAFLYILKRTRALQDGPSQGIVALTLMIALTSAFVTGIIGIHPIFGAFMAGLICPHEGGFRIKLTEKIEDLISALFLPLYFALSGLGTNLGLLNTGMTWAYVVGIIAVAFTAKFVGASLAARANGLVWRECFTIGSLMSCKGLVELIVLNIGLQAKILSTRTFTMFVVMALVVTFMTTPLTSKLYPPEYQKKIESWRRGEIDWDTGAPLAGVDDSSARESLTLEKMESTSMQKLIVYLRLDNMPTILTFMSILGRQQQGALPKRHPTLASESTGDAAEQPPASERPKKPIKAHGVRLIELTERESSVMKVSEQDEYTVHDPIVNTFRTFGGLHNMAVSGEVNVLPQASFADSLVNKASEALADLILLPWSETGSMSESQLISSDSVKDKLGSSTYTAFVQATFDTAACSVAVFISRNFGGSAKQRPKLMRTRSALSTRSAGAHEATTPLHDLSHHIYFPFFGGADDRVALRFVLQLAASPDVTATIVHFETPAGHFDTSSLAAAPIDDPNARTPTTLAIPTTTNSELVPAERDAAFFSSLRTSLPSALASRVVFESIATTSPVTAALARAGKELGQNPKNAGDIMVVGRNQALREVLARENPRKMEGSMSGSGLMESTSQRCIGVVADAAVHTRLGASVVVLQARGRSE